MEAYRSIGFIGTGNMGGALVRGLINSGAREAGDIIVSDSQNAVKDNLRDEFPGIRLARNNREAACEKLVILAVKPQTYPSVIAEIRDAVPDDTIVVTIAVGLTLKVVSRHFADGVKIVRTMPNTPALVSEGMTALCSGRDVNDDELNVVRDVFNSVGKTVVLPEAQMDAYTALAGSSPAWVFMFLEALADGAVREGIPRNTAYEAAAQAILGSAKLAAATGLHPGVLKDRVCSPGGTTIAGVATLEDAGFRSAVIRAVADCTAKARRL